MERRDEQEVPSLAKELLAMIAAGIGKSVLFKAVASGQSTTLQWTLTHLRAYGFYLLDMMGF